MKLAITIQTPEVPAQLPVALLTGSLEEKIRKAAEYGAHGVEIVPTQPASLSAADLSGMLRANGLGISGVASGAMLFAAKLTLLNPDPAIAELARQRLAELIVLASDLEAPVVTVGSFRGFERDGAGQTRQDLMAILRQAGDLAAPRGVRLAIEPLNRYEGNLINNVHQGLDFLRELNHPAVGLLLDTYHMNIEEASWVEPIQHAAGAGKLFHVHLGDNNRLPPGKGMIDFRGVLQALHAVGYDGWLTAELLGRPDPDTAARDTVQTILPLIKELA